MFRNFFGRRKSPSSSGSPVDSGYRADYGNLLLPPSAETAEIFWSLTDVERTNLKGLLNCAQEYYESVGQRGPISFHPEARAHIWGAALGKLADHFREVGDIRRGFFFALAAWNTSKHPVFAYNSGILALALGEVEQGKHLLKIYLDGYESVFGTSMCTLATPQFTTDDFERLANTARKRLAEL